MSKKVIGIDIDGTLTHPGYFIPYLNKKFNKNIDFDKVKIYDFVELYEVKKDDMVNYFNNDGYEVMFGQDLLENVKNVVNKLNENHKVYIITARSKEFTKGTRDWLDKVGFNDIELFCLGSPNKAEIAKELECDYFIEDHPTASVDIADSNNIPVILMDAPYNQETNHKNINRVFDWFDVEEFFVKEGIL